MTPNVKVLIDPNTMKIVYEVNGVHGESCTEVTALLTKDREIEDSGITEEFHLRDALPQYRDD